MTLQTSLRYYEFHNSILTLINSPVKFFSRDPLTTATNNLALVRHLSFIAINPHMQSVIPSWSGDLENLELFSQGSIRGNANAAYSKSSN